MCTADTLWCVSTIRSPLSQLRYVTSHFHPRGECEVPPTPPRLSQLLLLRLESRKDAQYSTHAPS